MAGFGRDNFETNAGEQPFDNDGTTFSADNTREAIIEARDSAAGFPRAGLPLIQNGTMGNNDVISYSNLTPNTPIVFPVTTKINEVTFANNRNSVEADIEIWKGGFSGILIKTLNINTGSGVKTQVFDLNADNITLNAGELLQLKYKDQGTNARDMVLVLWISRVP